MVCHKCKIELPLDSEHFSKSKTNKTGFRYNCKSCRVKQQREYSIKNKEKVAKYQKNYQTINKEDISKVAKIYRKNNKEKITENKIRYCNENKKQVAEYKKKYYRENIDKVVGYKKQYRVINKESLSKASKIYRENNKEKATEYSKKYQKENPGVFTMIRQRRRAKKHLLPNTLTIEQWENTKQCFNNKCAYCGRKLPLAQEHFISVINHGGYTVGNILPSCQSCNSSKGSKEYKEWYKKYKYYSIDREKAITEFINKNNQ